MACKASTSSLDFGAGCFACAKSPGAAAASASIVIIKTRCMKKAPSVFLFKSLMDSLFGCLTRCGRCSIYGERQLVMMRGLVAIPSNIGQPAQINMCPGRHVRVRRRLQGLPEKLLTRFRVIFQHRDAGQTIIRPCV